MNVATVKTGRRGRPAYPRLSGYLFSTQYLLDDSPVLCLESSSSDLFGEDSIYICPTSPLPSWVGDDLAHGYNPHVVFVTPGNPSSPLVMDIVTSLGVTIPVYFGRVQNA